MNYQDKKLMCSWCFYKVVDDVILNGNYIKFKCYACKRQNVLEINLAPFLSKRS